MRQDAVPPGIADKVMVIAGDTPVLVITGSYHYTFPAQYRNAENLVVLRGVQRFARAYAQYWRRHRAHSPPYGRE